jgi:hypothetical protein
VEPGEEANSRYNSRALVSVALIIYFTLVSLCVFYSISMDVARVLIAILYNIHSYSSPLIYRLLLLLDQPAASHPPPPIHIPPYPLLLISYAHNAIAQ